MRVSEKALVDEAYEQWQEQAQLRQKQDRIEAVLRRRHKPTIPRSMRQRARPVYADILGEKLEKGKVLICEPDGPRILVAANSDSLDQQKLQVELREWLAGAFRYNDLRTTRPFYQMIAEDLLLRGFAAALVLPNPGAWADMPTVDLAGLSDLEDQKRAIAETKERQLAYQRAVFPIRMEWAPAAGLIPVEGWDGLSEMWDFREMPVKDVLDRFRDDNGKPRARRLQQAVDGGILTRRDLVTVLLRADKDHLQIATLGLMLDRTTRQRADMRQHGVDEELFCEAHGMGEVPYAWFSGRETTSDDPEDRWKGLLDSIETLAQAYDDMLTQLYAAGRIASYPTLALEATEKAGPIGSSGKAPALRLEEGTLNRIPAGYKITNPQWTNSSDMQVLANGAKEFLRQIEMHTFQPAAYGDQGAQSGYLQQQLDAATKQVLEPFLTGQSKGYTRMAQLIFRAGAALIEGGSGPIPVRVAGGEGGEWRTLREAHLRWAWTIQAETRMQPTGGKAAQVATQQTMVQAGWMSNLESMEELGNRNPRRTIKQGMKEKLLGSEAMANALEQEYLRRVGPALQQQEAGVPRNPMIGAGLAAATTNPELLARLPAEAGMTPGPPLGGGPNTAAMNPAPPPPPVRPGVEGQSARNGQMQNFPGGVPQSRDVRRGGGA